MIKNELLFTVDESNNPAKPRLRALVHEIGLWHRTVHIWIINNQKQILCQKRSILKDMNPGKWEAFFGGHLMAGQDNVSGVLLEIDEELGININKKDLTFLFINKNKEFKEFQAIYYLLWNGRVADLKIEREEIDKVKWIKLQELKKMILKKNNRWTRHGYENKILKALALPF